LLEVLKKKMRAMKDELEAAKEAAEEAQSRLQDEIRRREEVSDGNERGRWRELVFCRS
jgi:hypothetical protein